jgi:hypothetical protein
MGGDIRVNVVANGLDHNLDVHTMGGEIEVTLPRDFDGDFSRRARGGRQHRVASDRQRFPVADPRVDPAAVLRRPRKLLTATGRSGSAANHVKISTIGSNITIRRK